MNLKDPSEFFDTLFVLVLALIALTILAPGKANAADGGWFMEAGIGFKVDAVNSWHVQTGCLNIGPEAAMLLDLETDICGGRNPTAYFSFGYERSRCFMFPNSRRLRCRDNFYVSHISHWRDGWPRNERMEFGLNEVRWTMRFGGAR